MKLIVLFLLGTVIGSTAYCYAMRSYLGISQIPRSFCDHCHRPLQWWQLIPLLGFLIQKGKCHFCHSPINFSSSIIEFSFGLICCSFYQVSLPSLLFYLILLSWLLFLSLEDYFACSVSLLLLLFGIIINFLIFLPVILFHFQTQFWFWLMITLLFLITNLFNLMGIADTIILSFLFLIVGIYNFIMLLLFSSIGALLFALIFSKRKLPFIPAIFLGTLFIL